MNNEYKDNNKINSPNKNEYLSNSTLYKKGSENKNVEKNSNRIEPLNLRFFSADVKVNEVDLQHNISCRLMQLAK